jgi:hypothetical protein
MAVAAVIRPAMAAIRAAEPRAEHSVPMRPA